MFRENLSIVPVKTAIEQAQPWWLEHVIRKEDNTFVKQIYHTKETEKEEWKTEKEVTGRS